MSHASNGYDAAFLRALLENNPDDRELKRLVSIWFLERRGCTPDKESQLSGFGVETPEDLQRARLDLTLKIERLTREGSSDAS